MPLPTVDVFGGDCPLCGLLDTSGHMLGCCQLSISALFTLQGISLVSILSTALSMLAPKGECSALWMRAQPASDLPPWHQRHPCASGPNPDLLGLFAIITNAKNKSINEATSPSRCNVCPPRHYQAILYCVGNIITHARATSSRLHMQHSPRLHAQHHHACTCNITMPACTTSSRLFEQHHHASKCNILMPARATSFR